MVNLIVSFISPSVFLLLVYRNARDLYVFNSRKNEGMEPKQKQYTFVDVTHARSKVWCCKKHYCIGTWNVRSMNQGKLEVIKQEMKSECQHSRNQWTKMD